VPEGQAQEELDAPQRDGPSPPSHLACLSTGPTLLAAGTAMEQRVEQQLEGGRRAQVVQELQDVRLRQQPLTPVEGLGRAEERGKVAEHTAVKGAFTGAPMPPSTCTLTVAWAAMSAASMLRPGGPGAQKDTRRWLPPRARPSARCCAASAISAVSYSSTAKPFSCPSWPHASCRGRGHEPRVT
jgi:hypothetical protein